MKKIRRSKTIWVNAVFAVLARFVFWKWPDGARFLSENPDLAILLLSFLNILLRFFTKSEIQLEVPRMLKRLSIMSLLFIAACSVLKYSDDLTFLVSAQAESPEFPVSINGSLCRDTDGLPGICSKRIKSGDDLTIALPERDYGYRLELRCSKDLNASKDYDIIAGQPFTLTISADKIGVLKSFICIGEIFPRDRSYPISALWEVRVKVVDKAYNGREEAYLQTRKGKTYLVMGEHARSVSVLDNAKWKHFTKKPIVEIKGNSDNISAFSESFNMRFNYFLNDIEVAEEIESIHVK